MAYSFAVGLPGSTMTPGSAAGATAGAPPSIATASPTPAAAERRLCLVQLLMTLKCCLRDGLRNSWCPCWLDRRASQNVLAKVIRRESSHPTLWRRPARDMPPARDARSGHGVGRSFPEEGDLGAGHVQRRFPVPDLQGPRR